MLLSKTSNVKLKPEGCSHTLRMPQGKVKHCMPFGIYKEMTGKLSLIDVVNELYLGARSGDNTAKHQCRSLFFNRLVCRRPQVCNFIWKNMARVVYCKVYEILKNTFFTEQLWTTASEYIGILTARKFQC